MKYCTAQEINMNKHLLKNEVINSNADLFYYNNFMRRIGIQI